MSKMYAPEVGTKIGDLLQGTVMVMGFLKSITNGVGTVEYENWDIVSRTSSMATYEFKMPKEYDVKAGDVVTVIAYAERGVGNVAEHIMNKGIYKVCNPMKPDQPVLLIIMGIAGRKNELVNGSYVPAPLVFTPKDIAEQSRTKDGKTYTFPAHQEYAIYLKQDQSGKLTDVVKFADYVGKEGNDHAAKKAYDRYSGMAQPNYSGNIPLLSTVMTAIVDIRAERDQTPYEKKTTYNNVEQLARYWNGKVRVFDYSWGTNSIDTVFEKASFNRTPVDQGQQAQTAAPTQTQQTVAQQPTQPVQAQQQTVAQPQPEVQQPTQQQVLPESQDVTSDKFLAGADELPFA